MKKNLPFLFILFLYLSSTAQTWCPPGATWHYRQYGTSPVAFKNGTLKLEYTSTLTINTIVCKELKGTFYGSVVAGDDSVYTIPNYVTYRTYEANNVAYLFNVALQKFDTIANFNAKPGDSWHYALYNTHCDDAFIPHNKVTVYDTGHVVINGMNLKKLVVSPANVTPPVLFIERIGGASGFLFMQQDCIQDGWVGGDSFSCYSDNAFPNYSRPGITDCNYNTVSLREQTLASQHIKLYPNPNTGSFNLELIEPSEVQIVNTLGAEVYKNSFKERGTFAVDVQTIAPGIYYLKTQNATGKGYSKFIKQ